MTKNPTFLAVDFTLISFGFHCENRNFSKFYNISFRSKMAENGNFTTFLSGGKRQLYLNSLRFHLEKLNFRTFLWIHFHLKKEILEDFKWCQLSILEDYSSIPNPIPQKFKHSFGSIKILAFQIKTISHLNWFSKPKIPNK